MLSAFIGRMGNGKTLGMTAVAVEHRTNSLQTAMETLHGWPEGSIRYDNYAKDMNLQDYIKLLEDEGLDELYPRLLEAIASYLDTPLDEHEQIMTAVAEDAEKGMHPMLNETIASVVRLPLDVYPEELEKLSPKQRLLCIAAMVPKENWERLSTPDELDAFSYDLQESRPVRIFATYHLSHIQSEFLDLDKFVDIMEKSDSGETVLANCLFLIDEAYLFFDARRSSSKPNLLFEVFISQTRKRGVDVYMSSHTLDKIDRRIRGALHFTVACRFNNNTQFSHMTVHDLQRGRVAPKSIYGPTIYPFYDTNEIVHAKDKRYRISKEYTSPAASRS